LSVNATKIYNLILEFLWIFIFGKMIFEVLFHINLILNIFF